MKKNTVIWSLVGLASVALIAWLIVTPGKPGKLDAFATCLADEGSKFYGAFWCPRCGEQKAMFGRSARLIPYVECSTPDGRGQLDICVEAGIEGYPTWEFADGSRVSGVTSLDILAEKTSCELPE